ncbi:type II toxin-antitoxin system PemK/MazF family toxin [Archaeoglobales archaeon]|nr:MAG: type II toxin-antitoxin system PemK/MazF family toxin [Archaeoglobales archaeon]
MKGKIVLVPFPFTDLSASKLRPALVLHEGDRDVVVAFISSKIPPQPAESDVIVTKNHPEFPLTGLKVDSVIKLDKIATLSKNLIIGEIGEVGKTIREEVNKKLCKILRI